MTFLVKLFAAHFTAAATRASIVAELFRLSEDELAMVRHLIDRVVTHRSIPHGH